MIKENELDYIDKLHKNEWENLFNDTNIDKTIVTNGIRAFDIYQMDSINYECYIIKTIFEAFFKLFIGAGEQKINIIQTWLDLIKGGKTQPEIEKRKKNIIKLCQEVFSKYLNDIINIVSE